MNKTRQNAAVLFLMLLACVSLWSKNQQLARWPVKVTPTSAERFFDKEVPASRALALAKGLALIQQPGGSEYLQTAQPITAEQFNLWLRALAAEKILPVSLTLMPAAGEGKLNLSDIGFKH